MIEYQRLKDFYISPMTKGVFRSFIDAGLTVPWDDSTAEATRLDSVYHFQRSGQKIISPLVENYLSDDETLSDENRLELSMIIFSIFGDKWSKLWEAWNMEYNPIENYSMVEDGTDQDKHTGNDATTRTGSEDNSGAITKTGTETNSGAVVRSGSEKDSGKVTKTGSERDSGSNVRSGSQQDAGSAADNTRNSNHNVYGFNSSSGVPSDADTETASHKNITTYNDVTDTISNTHTYQSVEDETDKTHTYNNVTDTDTRAKTYNLSDADTRKKTYNNIKDEATFNSQHDLRHHLTRSGNIGVTTSQQMLESELDLRQWIYFENVMKDIDSLLTLNIY